MTKRSLLAAVSALTVFAGGAFLSTPAQASDFFACSETQKAYARGAIRAECNCGGVAYLSCDGYDIDIHSIQCYACAS